MTRPSLAGIETRAEAHQDWRGRLDSRERVETALASAADTPALNEAVRDVLALHASAWPCGNPRHTNPDGGCPECEDICADCSQSWPCATVYALATHLDLTDPEGDPT